MTIITDLRLVANGDQWGAVAELEDGTEIPVWAVNGNDGVPPWLGNEKEYEHWYNLALEEAHKKDLFLEGELESAGKERNKPMLYEPDEATLVAKKAASAIEALGDVVRHASDDIYEVKCIVPEDLAMAMGMYAAYHMAPGRCTLGEAWKGPGFYEIWNDIGASQAQDWTKLDDSVVLARKTTELP